MKPTITLVDCDVTSATILWTLSTSLNFRYTPPFQQGTLQLSERNDEFLNCSYEKIETNVSSVYILTLLPNTNSELWPPMCMVLHSQTIVHATQQKNLL